MQKQIKEIHEQMVMMSDLAKQAGHIRLNDALVRKQDLIAEQVLEIKLIHMTLEQYFEEIGKQDPHDWDAKQRSIIIATVEQIELALQKAWKFPESTDHHTWWYRVPHCVCPKMDNDDLMGVSRRVYSQVCPLHVQPTNSFVTQRGGLV